MDINQLKILDVIVNRKSFKKAAEQCFVSTSTLTRQVTSMEAEIGFPIFERSAFGVTLTEQGELFYQQTQSIPLLYESAVSSARQTGQKKQLVRLGIFGYTRGYVTRACAALKEMEPGLEFSYVSCQLLENTAALLNRRIDLCLLTDIQEADARLFVMPVFRCRSCVLTADGHPLARKRSLRMAELDGQTILLSAKKTESANCRTVRKLLSQACPGSVFREYQHPDQADALCQIEGYPIVSLSFLEPNEGFRRIPLDDAPPVLIGAACRREERALFLPLMERFRDCLTRSVEYSKAKEEGFIL